MFKDVAVQYLDLSAFLEDLYKDGRGEILAIDRPAAQSFCAKDRFIFTTDDRLIVDFDRLVFDGFIKQQRDLFFKGDFLAFLRLEKILHLKGTLYYDDKKQDDT